MVKLKERQARLQGDTGQEHFLTWGRSHSRNIKLEILMNLWGLSGDYYENMKFLGAVVIGGSHLLVSFFSRNPGGHSQGRWGRTWRKSSPSGAVWVAGAQCPGSLIEQKASSTEEGFQVRALD